MLARSTAGPRLAHQHGRKPGLDRPSARGGRTMDVRTRFRSGTSRTAVAAMLAMGLWAAWALPATASPNPWHDTGDMTWGHFEGAAVVLPTGKALVAGGGTGQHAEL